MNALPRLRVVAVGEPFRRDDGVGPAIAQRLREDARLEVRVVGGAGPDVLAALAGATRAVVVDAVRSGLEAGTLHILGPEAARAAGPALSGHGHGLADALRLGEALGRLPERLLVLGVEAGECGYGEGLSQAVVRAVPGAIRIIERLATQASWEEASP